MDFFTQQMQKNDQHRVLSGAMHDLCAWQVTLWYALDMTIHQWFYGAFWERLGSHTAQSKAMEQRIVSRCVYAAPVTVLAVPFRRV